MHDLVWRVHCCSVSFERPHHKEWSINGKPPGTVLQKPWLNLTTFDPHLIHVSSVGYPLPSSSQTAVMFETSCSELERLLSLFWKCWILTHSYHNRKQNETDSFLHCIRIPNVRAMCTTTELLWCISWDWLDVKYALLTCKVCVQVVLWNVVLNELLYSIMSICMSVHFCFEHI